MIRYYLLYYDDQFITKYKSISIEFICRRDDADISVELPIVVLF